jgi:diaminohydroxyphosphoribosylaminopyrimidine deaminase/5-amino-6-(5-phosphoribosylamino)uracil reductase
VIVTKETIGAELAGLAERGITSILVEGGPALHRAFWAAGVVDRVQIIETAVTLGHGVEAFRPPAPAGADARRIGDDLLIEWHVHRPD